MYLYLSLFLFLTLLTAVLGRQKTLRKQLYYVLFAFLFLFSAFRFETGCDWWGYLSQYQSYFFNHASGALQGKEPLWVALFAFMDWADLSYPWLNVITSAIFFIGIHFLARRQPNPWAYLVLLFPILIINMPMSAIRQASAIGVIALAFSAFIDRRLVVFVLLVLAASALHSSAAVFFLLAPLVHGNVTKIRLALAGLLALPGTYLLLTSAAAEVATSRYVATGIDAVGAAYRVGLLVLTGFLFLGLLRRRWAEAYPRDYTLVLVSSIVMSLMVVLVPISSVIGDRLAYYFLPIQGMIFARIPHLQLGNNRQFLTVAPYAVMLLVLAVWSAYSWHFQLCYVPYQSWLFGYPAGQVTYN